MCSGSVGYSGCEFFAHAVGFLVLDRISRGIEMSRLESTILAARIGMEKKSDQKGQGKVGRDHQTPEEPLHSDRSRADPFSQT